MDVPTPQHAVAALAAFVRQRLVDVGDTLAPLWSRRDEAGDRADDAHNAHGGAPLSPVTLVVCAGAPFAPTPQARVRLLRQAHASGVLTGDAPGTLPAIGGPRMPAALGAPR
jgi:hypothetical protein